MWLAPSETVDMTDSDNPSAQPPAGQPARRGAVQRGFTLVELMIVVVIVAVLVGLALPSYRQYVMRGHRADAQAFLSDLAARQQHFLLDRRSYAVSITDPASVNGLALTVPASVSAWYAVTLVTDNAARPPGFVLSATPTAAQAADSCGELNLDQSGNKSAAGTGACW